MKKSAVPVLHRTPAARRVIAALAVGTVLVGAGLLGGATPAAAAPPATVSGQACLPGQGVTVAVDYAPIADELQIGCAIGAQKTIALAGAAAGFTFNPTTGFLTGIGNQGYGTTVVETGTVELPRSYWSIYINTTTGQPNGPLTDTLGFAQTGIDGAGLAVDTVLLFDFVPDYLSAPPDVPRVAYADLGATAPGNAAVDPPGYAATGDGSALAAAGWIGRQLESNGGVLPGPGGGTDYGLTMDAIFALAAAGVGGDDIAVAAGAVDKSGTGYLGAAADADANAGKIAKMTLALQVAGLDPTVFPDGAGGTRNLLAELRLSMTPTGGFGPNDFPLVHALAVLALHRTSGGVPAQAITWLQATQCVTAGAAFGGYGFSGCGDVDVDGTTLAVQALLAAGIAAADPSVADASSWLTTNQGADGGMLSSFGAPNSNGTGLAGQTFLTLGATDAAAGAAGFIGGLQVSCDSLVAGSLLTPVDVGGIAYDAAGFAEGNEFGIDAASVDQWVRAGTQAILGLGLPAFDAITAAGADPALPAAAACKPVTPAEPVVPVGPPSSSAMTVSSTLPVVVGSTSSGPHLSNTGTSNATVPMIVVGVAAIVIGFAFVELARRTRGRQHG